MPDPSAHEVVPAPTEVGNLLARCVRRNTEDLGAQIVAHTFVGIEIEDPGIVELDVLHRPVLMRCPVVEGPLNHAGTMFRRDVPRSIGADAVENHNIVEPLQAVQACTDVCFLISREDQDGNAHEFEDTRRANARSGFTERLVSGPRVTTWCPWARP